MSKGWIYLKKMTDHNGNPTAYCFGLTGNDKRRKRAYRKENPFIVHLEDFKTVNMKAAEDELIAEAKLRRWLLLDNSDEWIKADCFEDFKIIWKRVKDKHSVQGVRKRKAAKRKRRQAVYGVDVMGDPMTAKQKRDRERQIERDRLLGEAAAMRQQQQFRQPPPPTERQDKVATAQSIAAATDETPALLQALGEMIAVTFVLAIGTGIIGIAVSLGEVLVAFVPVGLCIALMWFIGKLTAPEKSRRRKAW